MFIMIDNYDSFTYNLVHLFSKQGAHVKVFRNDVVSVDDIEAMQPDGVILSPGPGRPPQAGICMEIVTRLSPTLPILGVCLGHQSIAEAFGAKIIHAPELFHGKGSQVTHNGAGLFEGLKESFFAMRYHSLIVERESLPDCLEITAEADSGEIMGLKHREFHVTGVQFHPESVAAEEGGPLVKNFIEGRY